MVLVWMALGFKLAFAKGQMGRKVTWIGGTLHIEPTGIRAFVKQSIIDDIREMIALFRTLNLLSKKELHSLIGKVNHAAGLLIVIRPFMDPLWAAWAAPSPEDKPGLLWAKQINVELVWFDVFFSGKGQRIERFFSIDSYNRNGTLVEIGTDASVWGIGGWLSVDGVITQYFASQLTELDFARFGFKRGDNKGQQVWEALAVLVAVDLWTNTWAQ